MVSQNQLLPTLRMVTVRTRAALIKFIEVHRVGSAAWPLFELS